MGIEEEIARARRDTELANDIAGVVCDEIKRVWPDLHPLLDLRYGIADRVIALPLLNRVRAEGAAEALESAADHINRDFQHLPSWYAAWETGERTRDWEIGCTRTLIDTVDWLRARAASVRAVAIEQNSEGVGHERASGGAQ